jgi:hypothetical protein
MTSEGFGLFNEKTNNQFEVSQEREISDFILLTNNENSRINNLIYYL